MKRNHGEYIARINRVIDFIMNNLDKQHTVPELAAIACFSEYHFHRIFRLIVGESLNVYVRRARLERAANMVRLNPRQSITEIALDYGFSSSANFAKAFRAHFDITPSEYRLLYLEKSRNGKTNSKNGKVNSSPMKDYGITLNQLEPVELPNVEIKPLPPLHLAYVRTLQGYDESSIEEAWDKLITWARARGMINDDTLTLGIEHDDPELSGLDSCRYDACITIPERITNFDGEIGVQDLPGGIYVTYTFTVHNNVGEMMGRSYSEIFQWIVANGIVPANSSSYSLYHDPFEMDEGRPARITICIMIQPMATN
ncbi:AraC family transcriptional regulator [bacterium]|nr:AraC family transcriptional regulator [bacterium]